MIYLKLFENFDLGFREISYGSRGPVSKGIEKFNVKNINNFTNSEIDQIEKILEMYNCTMKYEYDNLNVEKVKSDIPVALSAWMPYKDMKSTKKNIRIEKYKDEWFKVVDYPFFYECDQIDGVINFLKTILPEKVEEAFGDEYYSKFDPDKYSERGDYWKGYLSKLKNDQDELGKELEEDPNYFTLVDGDEVAELFERLIDFEKDEVVKIKGLFTNKYFIEEGKWKRYNSDNIVTFIEAIRPKFCKIRIWKLEDEWYIVSTSDADGRGQVFDKCDQFDGLKRLLNKTLVK